jgi:exopolyphosphatase / guanosine-5'-triphosphate,3'-diphosphate pyrophosphatase
MKKAVYKPVSEAAGWGTWIRTRTNGVRVRGSTVNLFPKSAGRMHRRAVTTYRMCDLEGTPNFEPEPARIAPLVIGPFADRLGSTKKIRHLAASICGSRGPERSKVEDPQGGALPQSGAARQGAGDAPRHSNTSQKRGDAASGLPSSEGRGEGQPQNETGKRSRRRRRRRRGQSHVQAPASANAQTSPAKAPAKSKRRGRSRGNRGKNQRPTGNTIAGAPAPAKSLEAQASVPDQANAPVIQPRPDLFAALDLGTNNCRLLIAAPTKPGQFRVIDAFSRIVRLGEGLTANGRLGEAAMDRAIEALKICAGKLAARRIFKSRLIATEACRSAANGAEFLRRVKGETRLELEIVDRETEARLAVSGCGPLVNRDIEAIVLFDIGGGSSEIALIDVKHRKSPHLADHIIAWTSLPVGVVSLAERYGGRNVTSESYQAMIEDVLGMIAKFAARDILGVRAKGEKFHLLGTSGTVTTLAGIHLGLARYDRRQVDGLWMEAAEVTAMTGKLLSWSFDERVANACIGAERADLVLGGCAILDAIRQTWPSERLRVADRGLREGLLTEMMSSAGVWRRRFEGDVRP